MSEDQDALLRLIAKLYYLDDLGQSEISEIVGISRSQVSRLLTRAREKGILRISVEEYDPRDRLLESEMKSLFNLRHVYVIKTLYDTTPDHVRRSIGYFGAPLLSELLRPNTVVGVAGGRALFELVRCMKPSGGTHGVSVVQLMGNIGPSVSNNDAIELSRTLAQQFLGAFYTLNAPVYVPDARTRDAFLSHEHVSSIWKLYSIMNVAMVGIGSLSDSSFIARGVLGAHEFEQFREKKAVGEICGHFYNASGEECDTEHRGRVISIGLDELKNTPEVIGVVTSGPGRVEAIYAAVSAGLVKSLLLDDSVATSIVAKAKEIRGLDLRSIPAASTKMAGV